MPKKEKKDHLRQAHDPAGQDRQHPQKRGSKTTFLPDKRVFEDTVFNHDTVDRRLRELAYLNKGVSIACLPMSVCLSPSAR